MSPTSFFLSRACKVFAALTIVSGPCVFAEEGQKDYVIFVGLDPSVQFGAEACPIVNARLGSVDVIADGRQVSLATNNLAAVETMAVPKISGVQVEIQGARTEPGYAGMGPGTDRDRQQILMNILAVEQQTKAINDWKEAYSNARVVENSGSQADINAAQAQLGAATTEYDRAVADTTRLSQSAMGTNTKEKGYNALIYTAQVSAAREISGAYGMVYLVVRDPQNPQIPLSTVRFLSLPKIGPKAQNIRIPIGIAGLPDGFSVEGCDLHVFVEGREIATSGSRNRAEVTLDEAHQFLLFRYLTENLSATEPPKIIAELVPPDLAMNVEVDQRWITVDFAIDSEGMVADMTPASNAPELSPDIKGLLRSLRFYPGLTAGSPVKSRATFALSEFVR